MRRTLARGVAIGVALAVSLSATSSASSAPAPLQRFYEQRLVWKTCQGKLECATYRVPLDYGKPDGRAITLKVARNKAVGTPVGNLYVNPGGPGGSGITYVKDPEYAVSATVRRNFNLIGFDPRGVGQSTPLWCLRGARLDAFLDVDPSPDNAAEQQDIVRASAELIASCQREDAALMAHLSVVEMARDLDILRALMGDARLRYLGKSWGSVLGKVYASLFPKRVGSFVLDGAVDVTRTPVEATYDQGVGFEDSIDRFLGWCLDQGSCPLGKTQAAAKQRLLRFVSALDANPLPTDDPRRPLTEAQAYTAIIGPLYIRNGGWDWLLQALTPAIESGKGAALQRIYDWFVERNRRGVYANNANTVIFAVNCLDGGAHTVDAAEAVRLTQVWKRTIPFMAAVMAWSEVPCAGWPFRAATDMGRLRVRDVPPILVVSATHDPATPVAWGRAMARQLPGSVLLVRDGDGHTSYGDANLCINRAVDTFLLSRSALKPDLPPAGTVCRD